MQIASPLGYLGVDECFGATHLNEPAFATVPETKWALSHTALPGGISLTIADAVDADLAAFFADPAGQLFVAKGAAIAVDDVFTVGDNGDTTDNALQAAKGAAVAANDVFKVTNIVAEAVIFLHGDLSGPNGTIQVVITDGADADLAAFFASPAGELFAAKGIAIEVGDIFHVNSANDTFDDALEAAKTAPVAQHDLFVVTGIGGAEAVIYVGSKVAVYSFSQDKISKLSQTAANRAIAGVDMRAYVYTYTITNYVTPDNTVFTLEGFGDSVVLPHSAGVAREVFFAAPAGASLADFEIRATSDGATQGVVTIDDQILCGIVKEGVTPTKGSHLNPFSGIWGAIQAIGGVANASATGREDTGITSFAFVDGGIIYGRFTEIRPTAGIILAYRVKN